MQTKTFTVFTDSDGAERVFAFTNRPEMMRQVFNLLSDEYDGGMDDDVLITLPSGFRFWWDAMYAHYCFAKGRISEREALRLMIERKGAAV